MKKLRNLTQEVKLCHVSKKVIFHFPFILYQWLQSFEKHFFYSKDSFGGWTVALTDFLFIFHENLLGNPIIVLTYIDILIANENIYLNKSENARCRLCLSQFKNDVMDFMISYEKIMNYKYFVFKIYCKCLNRKYIKNKHCKIYL